MADVRGFSAKHLRVRIVYAHIKTYKGTALGATHWMGRLKTEGCEPIELTRELTVEQAEVLNRKDGGNFHRAGGKTNRFLAQQDVRREATRVFGQSFPLAVLLIEGNDWCMDPQHVLIGPPDAKEKLNALVARADKIHYWDHKENERAMQEISTEWDDIINEIERS